MTEKPPFWTDLAKQTAASIITAAVLAVVAWLVPATRAILLLPVELPLWACSIFIGLLGIAVWRLIKCRRELRRPAATSPFVPTELQEQVLQLIRLNDKPLDMSGIVLCVDDAKIEGGPAGTRDIELAVRALVENHWLEHLKNPIGEDTYHLDRPGLEFCRSKGFSVSWQEERKKREADADKAAMVPKFEFPALETMAENILLYVAERENVVVAAVASRLNIGVQLAMYYLDELERRYLCIPSRFANGDPTEYRVNANGRRYLVERNLLK